MGSYLDKIDRANIPAHIAIIMDGNGRWAKKRSLPRIEGHRRGSDVIEPVLESAADLGVRVISVYAFSTENWLRPSSEVMGLWALLEDFFDKKLPNIMKQGVQIKHSGSLRRLPPSTKKSIIKAIETTERNKRITLNLCLNYGSRQEIVDAVNTWHSETRGGKKLTLKKLEKYLMTARFPDVDLLIRTSGEYRLSNFLLWQLAYAELFFTETLWPDFAEEDLYEAVYQYQQRDRRFGGL